MRNLLALFRRKQPQTTIVPQTVNIGFTSILSEHTQSAGHMLIRNSIRIDGTHIGKIVKDPASTELITVIVSKTGRVEGLINADILIVEGSVSGTTRSTVGLYVTGCLEGIAFYGDTVEVKGEPSARLVRMNDRQKSLPPLAPSFDAKELLNGCNFMPDSDAEELKIQFEDVENLHSNNGDVIDILFQKNKNSKKPDITMQTENVIDVHEQKSGSTQDISSSKVTTLRVITAVDQQSNATLTTPEETNFENEDDSPNLVTQYYS